MHDCFTIAELTEYEALGFCERGRAVREVEAGTFILEGDLPVNTDGGLKAFGHPLGATGLRMCNELYLQLSAKFGWRMKRARKPHQEKQKLFLLQEEVVRMGERLKGKGAVVTGAGRGIGREIALALAEEGAGVVVVDPGAARDGSGTDLALADQVVSEIKNGGGRAVASFHSVTDFKAAEDIIKSCVDSFGSVDIVVNCAGILRERMIWNMTEDDWDSVIAVHLKGTFNVCRHACVKMREQRSGRIINLTSDAWRGTVGQSNYGSAKGGIVSLTRAIAREMGRYGVTANCVAPIAATRMTMTEEVKAGMKKRLESGLITREFYDSFMAMPGPEYVPPMVVYLASEAAANINGRVFHIEKGRAAIYSEPVETLAIYKINDDGMFTVEELAEFVPKTLLTGYVNPAPAEPPKEKKN